MLRGLCKLQRNLKELGIPFFLLQGQAVETIPKFLKQCDASVLIVDFSPLRIVRKWKDDLCKKVTETISVHEVDAHNIVPVWVASEKLEYSARTIRSKIHRLLPEYLIEFPDTRIPIHEWKDEPPAEIDWENLIGVVSKGADVPEVQWCEPGENAAMDVLLGSKNGFLSTRLKHYSTDRNNPLKPKALSVDAFLEEMIIRRELADNYCFYQPEYDSIEGAWEWARKTLMDHASDKREHVYTKEELEMAKTADPLWNASQLEMVHYGKMHGFMRMYWAKKILEWTSGPQEALSIAIYLNGMYELDGRDPSGYVGCMWSICGVHDQVKIPSIYEDMEDLSDEALACLHIRSEFQPAYQVRNSKRVVAQLPGHGIL